MSGTAPGSDVAAVVHVGGYDTIHEAYQALGAWLGAHDCVGAGPAQEICLNDPNQPSPNVTEIRMPVTRP